MVKTITVGKIGTADADVDVIESMTYADLVKAAGFTQSTSIMSDMGYVTPTDIVSDDVSALIMGAPKMQAGFGALPNMKIEDDAGNAFELVPVTAPEQTAEFTVSTEAIVEAATGRTITVGKMGTAGIPIEIDGMMTYRAVVEKAGFTTFKAIMASGLGYVNADEPIAEGVSTLILSAPKFDAGFGALPSMKIEDDAGNAFELVPVSTPEEDAGYDVPEEVLAEAMTGRTVTVGKMGTAGIPIEIDGMMTYRAVVEKAGFTTFKAIMASGLGYVNADEPIAEGVSTLILSAPKFDAGYARKMAAFRRATEIVFGEEHY